MRIVTLRFVFAAMTTAAISWASQVNSQAAPRMEGRIVWTSTERDDTPLTDVSDLVVDSKQRAFVADGKESAIYMYGSDGAFLTKFGHKGAGPGEFQGPCCMAFDAKGRLWLKDTGGSRYVVFTVNENGNSVTTKPAFVVRMPHTDNNWGSRTHFDSAGNVISIGHYSDSSTKNSRGVKRFVMDTSGKTLRSTIELAQTDNFTPPFLHTTKNGTSTVTMYLYQPFGAVTLRADGPFGTYALAGSGKYSVRWFAANGKLLRTVARDVTGPRLTSNDRAAGDSQLVAIAKRAKTNVASLPFKLPANKPPLAQIYFDADGRLWVQRTTNPGSPREADVYAPDGKLAFTAVWPESVRMATYGFIKGTSAWGLTYDGDDVPHIVRMVFTVTLQRGQ